MSVTQPVVSRTPGSHMRWACTVPPILLWALMTATGLAHATSDAGKTRETRPTPALACSGQMSFQTGAQTTIPCSVELTFSGDAMQAEESLPIASGASTSSTAEGPSGQVFAAPHPGQPSVASWEDLTQEHPPSHTTRGLVLYPAQPAAPLFEGVLFDVIANDSSLAVPEPSSAALCMAGLLLGLAGVTRRPRS